MFEVKICLEVTTPMFSAGADIGGPAEFRISELKSAMRFGWRAFQPPKPLPDLYKQEEKIFGMTERAGFRIIPESPLPMTPPGTAYETNKEGIKYLWFFCTQEKNQDGRRAWIKSEKNIELRFRFTSDEQAKHGLIALWLAEQFGGLGYRSRKAAGCFRVISIKGHESLRAVLPAFLINVNHSETLTIDQIKGVYQTGIRKIHNFFGAPYTTCPPYTAITNRSLYTRLFLYSDFFPSWEEAVHHLGHDYKTYRAYDNPTVPTNGQAARDLHGFANGRPWPPKRTAIEKASLGLPIQFRFKDGGKLMCEPVSKDHNRRASPLFFHVGKLSKDHYWGMITLLWGDFLEDREKIHVYNKVVDNCVDPPSTTDYILDFFYGLREQYTQVYP